MIAPRMLYVLRGCGVWSGSVRETGSGTCNYERSGSKVFTCDKGLPTVEEHSSIFAGTESVECVLDICDVVQALECIHCYQPMLCKGHRVEEEPEVLDE